MPKKGEHPYNRLGRLGTYPWRWAWEVPTSKGTGTPYIVSVRGATIDAETIWGCNCAAGKNGHPSCQHRMRVKYDIVTVPNMLANLPAEVRALVAPNTSVIGFAVGKPSTKVDGIPNTQDERRLKVVN